MLAAKGLKDHLLDGFGTSYDTMGIFNVSIKRPPFKWLVKFDSSELYVIAIVRTFYQLIASAFQIWCNVYFQTLVMWNDVDECLFNVSSCYICFNYLFYAADFLWYFKILVFLCWFCLYLKVLFP